jgi:hypothetical protein
MLCILEIWFLNKIECSTHRRIACTSFSGREFDSPHLHCFAKKPEHSFGLFSFAVQALHGDTILRSFSEAEE